MKKNIILFLAMSFLVVANSYAENFSVGAGPIGNIYVVNSRPELDPGAGGYVFFDYRWSPQISTQFNVIVTTQDGKNGSKGDNGILFLGIPTVDFKYYLFSSESHFDPYLMAGIGFYTISEGSVSNGTFAIGGGANVGVGMDYYLSEKWSLGLVSSFRTIGLIDSTSGSNNGTSLFPLNFAGNVAFHF